MYDALAPLPDTGHVFDTSWPVLSSDLDEDQHLRPDGVARYLQEAGMRHLEATDMVESHPHWIVRRTVIDVLLNQQNLFNAQQAYALSKYNFLQSRLLLDQAAGTLDADDVQDVNRMLTVDTPVGEAKQ